MNVKTRTTVMILAVVAFLLVMTRFFFIDIMVVQGVSMEPTLREGTLILVNKMAFGIQVPFSQRYLVRWGSPSKNDIVVFTSPLDGLSTIKRCLAVAGDPLKVTAGKLVVGDTTLPLKFYQEEIVKPISRIPPESVFVAGDNAYFSTDSRSFGPLSVDAIKGSIFLSLPKKEETHER